MVETLRQEVGTALYGAWRMAMRDPNGLFYLDRTPHGAWRSFLAALPVVPAQLALALWRLDAPVETHSLPWLLAVELLAAIVSWTGFALLMSHITGFLDRKNRYPDFLCAYNWSSVIQMALYLPAVLLTAVLPLPELLANGVLLGVSLALLSYEWFVIRTALQVSGGMTAGIILLELFFSSLVTWISDSLL